MLAALGVVFGDIGTSPLYAMQTVFTLDDGLVKPTSANVYGVISMTFWAILLIVSVKQLMFILRADNDGEGGILSLAYLTRGAVKPGSRRFTLVMLLGVFGASLFFGDSLITPAISVLSAVEGLKVPAPGLADFVLPIGLVIIGAIPGPALRHAPRGALLRSRDGGLVPDARGPRCPAHPGRPARAWWCSRPPRSSPRPMASQ